MVKKQRVTIIFTKYVEGRALREWSEERELITDNDGKRYIWWLKTKLPVALSKGVYTADVHTRKPPPVKLPYPAGYRDNINKGDKHG